MWNAWNKFLSDISKVKPKEKEKQIYLTEMGYFIIVVAPSMLHFYIAFTIEDVVR